MTNLDLHSLLKDKRLLIFDFDGTLADSTPLHAEAFARVMQPHGISVDYASIAGMKTLDAMHKLLAAAEVSLPEYEIVELAMRKQEVVRANITESLESLPGVDKFLHWAKPRFQLAIATSGSRGTVELALKKLGYAGLFDPILCADDVSMAKPDPEIFLSVLRITGVHVAHALVFEDSEAGFTASIAAGIEYININAIRIADFTR